MLLQRRSALRFRTNNVDMLNSQLLNFSYINADKLLLFIVILCRSSDNSFFLSYPLFSQVSYNIYVHKIFLS